MANRISREKSDGLRESMETNDPRRRTAQHRGVTLEEEAVEETDAEAELDRALRTLMVVAAFGPGSACT